MKYLWIVMWLMDSLLMPFPLDDIIGYIRIPGDLIRELAKADSKVELDIYRKNKYNINTIKIV